MRNRLRLPVVIYALGVEVRPARSPVFRPERPAKRSGGEKRIGQLTTRLRACDGSRQQGRTGLG